jgi:Ca2+:H+ antiporter
LPTQIAECQEATAAVTPQPQVSLTLTILLLVLVTVVSPSQRCLHAQYTILIHIFQAASVTADTLVESMNGISDTVRKEWVALILLPAVTSLAGDVFALLRSTDT